MLPMKTLPALPVHSFCDDAMGDLDAVAIALRIKSGDVSATEITEAAIARAERVNPVLNAMQLATYDQARRHSAHIEQSKTLPELIFTGIPTFVKDNTDLCGLPTNQGSRAVNAPPAKADNDFAKQFLAQGFVILGKSKMPEFGFNASTEFQHDAPTRNPWNTDFSCGASSGGSAALVAAGVVPIAHANDGGGSIRIPAACCGLIGLKPTRGRLVDGEAARALPVNIVGEGVLTRSVRDTAHFFAGAERSFKNPQLPPVGLVKHPAIRRLRIGVLYNAVTGRRSDDATHAAISATAALLDDLGHHVAEMPIPISAQFASDFRIYWGMLGFSVSLFGKRLMSPNFDARKIDSLSQGLASFYKGHIFKTPWVIHRLKNSWHEYAKVFENVDIILSPVLGHTTPQLGYLSPDQPFDQLFERLTQYACFTPWNNAAGGPAMSLPVGSTALGLPIGAHFSAAHGAERTLLELAFEIEQAAPWRRIQDSPAT